MIIEAQHYGVHPDDLDFISETLMKGRVGILPTDSVYAFCALMDNKAGYETLCKLKHLDPRDAMMSVVCRDLSQASAFFTQWDTPVYRILNKNLPGPFTFILNGGSQAPSFLKNKKKTLGLRIPQHPVVKSLMSKLSGPLIVTSVVSHEENETYFMDATEIIHQFEKQVSFIVVDEHYLQEESTVVDLTSGEPVVLRQGRSLID